MLVRIVSAACCTFALAAAGAPAASAESTGGVSAPGTVAAPTIGAAAPKSVTPVHHAPVTARTPNIAYSGPVFERTATGQVVPYVTNSASEASSSTTGGLQVGVTVEGKPDLLVPGTRGRIVDGLGAAPMSAPLAVQQIIWAGNQIVGLPYIYGGGHASFTSPGYDCSGTVSFALHGAALLSTPEDSGEFEAYGENGVGRWVTIFTNAGHAYMTVAGLRLDTSSADDPSNQQGPRWRPLRPANAGFMIRHPVGL